MKVNLDVMEWLEWAELKKSLGFPQLDLLAKGIRQDAVLNATHQLVGLLGQAEGQDLRSIG